jgi:hypothetical protein
MEEVAIGRVLANGSVRYVVRPIEWRWVLGMAVTSLVLSVVSFTSGAAWYALLIWLVLPMCVAWRSGFDVDVSHGMIRGWNALAFIPIGGFTLTSLQLPDVRTAVESHTDSEGNERSGKITRLWWGHRNLRVCLPPERLRALMKEARRVIAGPG